MTMYLTLEPTPGDAIIDCANEAVRIANLIGVKVQFRFNDVLCVVLPGAVAEMLVGAYDRASVSHVSPKIAAVGP